MKTKSIIFWAMLLLGSVSVLSAQEVVVFSDDFESGTLDKWTLIDADGDGYNWRYEEEEGRHYAYSNSMVHNPDNYMITPRVDGATRIEFKAWTDFDSSDRYQVLASSTGNDVEDFTEVVYSGYANDLYYAVHSFDLPENTRYIAFRHYNSQNQRFLCVDDVFVYGVGMINSISVDGFTAPFWGAHPDYGLSVPGNAHYAIDDVIWYSDGDVMNSSAVFNETESVYYMAIYFSAEEGYSFNPNATVSFNGDASINDAPYNTILSSGLFRAFTIDYYVDPTMAVDEQSSEQIVLWPNPANNTLYLEGLDGELVSVYDNTGRLVLQELYKGQLDVTALAQGIYALAVTGRTIKFIKQ